MHNCCHTALGSTKSQEGASSFLSVAKWLPSLLGLLM